MSSMTLSKCVSLTKYYFSFTALANWTYIWTSDKYKLSPIPSLSLWFCEPGVNFPFIFTWKALWKILILLLLFLWDQIFNSTHLANRGGEKEVHGVTESDTTEQLLLSHVWLCDPMDCSTARLPCPSLSTGTCSCPLIQWCHSTILSSVVPFFSHLQYFPVSGSFPMNRLFTSGSQSIRALSSAFPMNIKSLFPLGLTDLVSLLSKESLLQHHGSKAILQCSAFFIVQLSLYIDFPIVDCLHKKVLYNIWSFVTGISQWL